MKNPAQLPGGEHEEHRIARLGDYRAPSVWHPSIEIPSAPAAGDGDDIQVVIQYLQLLWRHKWVMALFLVLGCLTALAVSVLKTPLYSASTSLHIEEFQEIINPLGVGNPTLTTQAELLRSGDMRRRALAEVRAQEEPPLPEVAEPLAGVRRLLGLGDPMSKVPWDEAAGVAAGRFTVTDPPRDSFIVRISTSSPNPVAAAEYVNAMARSFIDSRMEARQEAYDAANVQLSAATQQLRDEYDHARQAVEDFLRSNGLVITGETSLTQENMLQTQAELNQAESARIAAEAAYESQRERTEVLGSSLEGEIARLEAQRDSLLVTLTPANPAVQQVQRQLDTLKEQADLERERIVDVSEVELSAARRRENELRQRYNALSRLFSDEGELRGMYQRLTEEAETAQQLYVAALSKGSETGIAAVMRPNGARQFDAARPSFVPVQPNLLFNFGLGIAGSLALGAGLVILRSRSDSRLENPGTLRPYLQVRELGVIPSAKTDPEVKALTRRSNGDGSDSLVKQVLFRAAGETGDPLESLELVTWTRKPSVFAEAFRATMTSILYSGENGARPHVLLVSSPSPKEGKSTVVSNLAIALAEINQRVLLVDGDMRLPRIHSIFDLPNTYGLSDVLHERNPIDSYDEEGLVRKTQIPGLYVLPAGPARASVTPLLHSDRMRDLVRRFRDSFDVVLIDAAPVLSVPDARVLARVSDAVILVVRAHSTRQEAAFDAVRAFAEDGTRILGTILNDWNPRASGYGYGGYYNAYYQSPYYK